MTSQESPELNPQDPEGSTPDPAQVLNDLREQIRRRRERLGGRLEGGGANSATDFSLSQLRQSVDEVNDLWFVSAHLPITWRVPGIGTAVAYAKRAVRVLLRWYINPIVEQQNRFNSAVARALVEVTAYQERLTREWQVLEERVLALEAVVSRQSSVVSDEGIGLRVEGSGEGDQAAADGGSGIGDPDAHA